MRGAIESHRGYVFRIAGDSFASAFHTASDALEAALHAQRLLYAEEWKPVPVRVRMGLNTGDAQAGAVDDIAGGYSGYSTLARAQRVMSVANGGQILLSNSSADLVRDELPKDITLLDMGKHTLKGLLQPEHLWQPVAPDLPKDFPPLATSDVVPTNLPGALNRFVGRAHELQEVKERLAHTRLLTLLGPGGTGKTRLALQAATDLLPEFDDRVYFVDLASSRDSDAVLSAIARTVGVREKSDKPLLDDLKNQINQQRMLSLLDNFEQVTVAAPTMAELLRDCPELKMLVTSREALHVRGENVFPVPPLALPEADSKQVSVEELAQSEAVQLFIERAQAVKPDFQLTNENAQAVAEICMRLDGLPLAIELATARLNVFTPQALAERLGNRLKLLRGGARDLPARQQTLRDTIDWSYEMLDGGEQSLFKLFSVFSGATFEAVEAVASQVERFDEIGLDVFDGVSSLVDKSLIRQMEEANGESRLRMLETIREFAAARLEEDAEFSAAACRAHAAFYADFTKSQWVYLTRDGRESALARLTADLENIRTAWRYWVAEKNLEQLGKFTDSLWMLYDARGWYHATVELTTDLLQVLSSTESTPERVREEILLQTGLARALLVTKGYTQEVEQAYARALQLCENAGEIPELFPVLRGLLSFYNLRADYDKALQMAKRILSLGERLDDAEMKLEGHLALGYNSAFANDLPGGLEHLETSIAGYNADRYYGRRLGLGANPGVVALAVSGLFLWMRGLADQARKRGSEAIALGLKLDHPFSLAYANFHFGLLHMWLGDAEITQKRARAVIDISEQYEFQIWRAVGQCLLGASMVALGSIDDGLILQEEGMDAYRGLHTPPVFWPMLLELHAASFLTAEKPQDGLALLDEAIQITATSSAQTLASEFLGLKGDLLLAGSSANAPEAESWYQNAVNIAQEVQAPMLELRAALKLSRLWQAQGKREQARDVLSAAYAKITEGFTIPDLKQARALLDELT